MGMPADIQYVHSRERLDASYLVGRARSVISASTTTPSMLIPIDSGPMRSSIGFVSIVLKYLNGRSSVYLYKQSRVRSRTGRSQRSGSTKTRNKLVGLGIEVTGVKAFVLENGFSSTMYLKRLRLDTIEPRTRSRSMGINSEPSPNAWQDDARIVLFH